MSIRTEVNFRLPNSPGAFAGVCRLLSDERVNITAMALESTGQLRLVLDNHVHGAAVLREHHHQVTERDVIVTSIPNAPGALAPLLRLVSDAHRERRILVWRRRGGESDCDPRARRRGRGPGVGRRRSLMRLYVEPMDAVVIDVGTDGRVRLRERGLVGAHTAGTPRDHLCGDPRGRGAHRTARNSRHRRRTDESHVLAQTRSADSRHAARGQSCADYRRQANRPRGRRPACGARRRYRARLRAVARRSGTDGQERARVGPARRDHSVPTCRRPTSARRSSTAAAAALGRIDILLNMASVYAKRAVRRSARLPTGTAALDVDLRASSSARARPCRTCAGRAAATSSISATGPPEADDRGIGATCRTTWRRRAVIALTEALALELAPDNILVNAIAPGPIVAPDGLERRRACAPSRRRRRSAGGAATARSPRRCSRCSTATS